MTSSLRDLKKAATSRELAAAARDLVREHGYDAVTIDQIAEHAGYSRRTFANHFSGKAEAVVDGFLQRQPYVQPDAVPETFGELIDATEAFMAGLLDGPALDDVRDFVAIAREHPALESSAHGRLQAFRSSRTLGLLSERFGTTRTTLFLSAFVGFLGGSFHAINDTLGRACTPPTVSRDGRPELPQLPDITPELRAQLRALMSEAFGYLRHGFLASESDATAPEH